MHIQHKSCSSLPPTKDAPDKVAESSNLVVEHSPATNEGGTSELAPLPSDLSSNSPSQHVTADLPKEESDAQPVDKTPTPHPSDPQPNSKPSKQSTTSPPPSEDTNAEQESEDTPSTSQLSDSVEETPQENNTTQEEDLSIEEASHLNTHPGTSMCVSGTIADGVHPV